MTMIGNPDVTITRVSNARGRFPLLAEMWVERGTHADWDLLSNLHYKLHSLPVGAKFWRLRFREQTIGVCVMGMSRPLLKERHAVFPLLRPGEDTQISNIHRYRFINDNFRVIGRFVVDTMFRSAGVAYRFANLASRLHGYRFIEIQSSMSRYNLFAQRAGFTMVKPIRSAHYDAGLKFMRRWFAAHPADIEALMEEFAAMPATLQKRVEKELKVFYFDHSPLEKTGSRRHYSAGVVENWDVRRTITKIQGLCFASPLYGFYRNPDSGVLFPPGWCDTPLGGEQEAAAPRALPLLAFDLQHPSEPLRHGLLDTVPGWHAIQQHLVTRHHDDAGEIDATRGGGDAEQPDQTELNKGVGAQTVGGVCAGEEDADQHDQEADEG